MFISKFTLCLSAFLAVCHAVPNDYEGPEAFEREVLAVGGNCNFTGACVVVPGFDPGECIGESGSACCYDSVASQCRGAGNACEFDPSGGLATCT